MQKKLNVEVVQKNLDELISKLQQKGGYIEIVKNNHTAAVTINFDEFKKLQRFIPGLLTKKKKGKKGWKLQGSLELVGDIEEASREISKSILDSIMKQEL